MKCIGLEGGPIICGLGEEPIVCDHPSDPENCLVARRVFGTNVRTTSLLMPESRADQPRVRTYHIEETEA